jgi:hypothetical protein
MTHFFHLFAARETRGGRQIRTGKINDFEEIHSLFKNWKRVDNTNFVGEKII